MTIIPGHDCIEDWFPERIMDRGYAYLQEGRVRVVEGGDGWVRAKVRGSTSYDVSIAQDPDVNDLRVACSCPYGRDDSEPCKHIWATLIAGVELEYLFLPDELPYPLPAGVFASALGRRRRSWRDVVEDVNAQALTESSRASPVGPGDRLIYVIDREDTIESQNVYLRVLRQRRLRNGQWGAAKPFSIRRDMLASLPDDDDRELLGALGGSVGTEMYAYRAGGSARVKLPDAFDVAPSLARSLLPKMCRAGRCYLGREQAFVRRNRGPGPRLAWEDDPWALRLGVERATSGGSAVYRLTMSFVRGADRLLLDDLALVAPGILIRGEAVAPLSTFGAFGWIEHIAKEGPIVVADAEGAELVARVLESVSSPPLEPPPEIRFEELELEPLPRLHIRPPGFSSRGERWLLAELTFGYAHAVVGEQAPMKRIVDAARRRVLVRSADAERRARARLLELPFKPARGRSTGADHAGLYDLHEKALPTAVRALVADDWYVEAAGLRYRSPGVFRMSVSSGVDWFDLEGEVAFDNQSFSVPELLAAHRRGETTVRLGDGSVGVLPDAWLARYAPFADLGKLEKNRVRFRPSQVALLDALLAAQPHVSVDARFEQARQSLHSFDGVSAADAPDSFRGRLRAYQREGLGWMQFLTKLGLGGCLADDMGLGKTVQVLALLESRRVDRAEDGAARKRARPSLVVAPRSLIFNWKAEASRFTPALHVLEHAGPARERSADAARDHDVILTSYGTLKRDIGFLSKVAFDVIVLDESQAIKNAATAAAKAARLLRGDHRLALSGTPIENHVGELWSLFEFLNPGLLGSASAFRRLSGGKAGPTREDVELIARAVRPLVLRRTKSQVARDLPRKVEQSLVCELGTEQRSLYDELRDHYRASLSRAIDARGLKRSKILVLEALLRLRQVSCHAGLVDGAKRGVASAKLDMLAGQLESVLAEGHKALVFSQFTSLLAIVREQLEHEGIAHAYLDGRTRNRQLQVETFQNDPACKLFLISLKAGGVGLNLTAAEYVYLLDPWWNPAVELQAIDRTHRIGQTRQVFAYRLIARDTVEEKIIELQSRKRELADSIIKADAGLVRSLSREDLELLLS